MKRTIQFVALMVGLLLVWQSAVAEMPCSNWLQSGGHSPACCMATGDSAGSHVSAGCHESMRFESVTLGCNEGGCQMATVLAAAPAVTTEEFKADGSTALIALTQVPVDSRSALTAWQFESIDAPGPARYLLFQVFRI